MVELMVRTVEVTAKGVASVGEQVGKRRVLLEGIVNRISPTREIDAKKVNKKMEERPTDVSLSMVLIK